MIDLPWWGYAAASAILTTVYMILRKKGTTKEHAMEFEMTRSMFMVIFIIAILFPFLTFKYSLNVILITYFVSIFVTTAVLLTTKSLRHAEISEVMPLSNLTPGFLAVLAFLLLGETLKKWQIVGLILTMIGAYILETDHQGFFKSFIRHMKSKYVDYAIFASLFFSLTALLDKYIISNFTAPLDYLLIIWFFTFVNFVIISSIKYRGIKGIWHCLKVSKHYVILTAFFSTLANAAYVMALSLSFVSLVIPIRRMSNLLVTIIGGEIFHEKALFRKSMACIVMLFGAYLIIM